MQNINILCDSANGVYIPKIMINQLKDNGWQNISDYSVEVLQNPEHEEYWNEWNNVLDKATYTDPKTGQVFNLHHDGDLFCYCPESMTPTEHYNLFGEFPEWYNQEEELA